MVSTQRWANKGHPGLVMDTKCWLGTVKLLRTSTELDNTGNQTHFFKHVVVARVIVALLSVPWLLLLTHIKNSCFILQQTLNYHRDTHVLSWKFPDARFLKQKIRNTKFTRHYSINIWLLFHGALFLCCVTAYLSNEKKWMVAHDKLIPFQTTGEKANFYSYISVCSTSSKVELNEA